MILLTGATGLLGSHLLAELLTRHDRVAALVRPASDRQGLREVLSCYTSDPDRMMGRIEWRTGDLLDPASLSAALEGIHVVVNCAAIVSFDPKEDDQMIANNTAGTANLIRAIKDREPLRIRLIHISSIAALGDGPGGDPGYLIDETTPRDPRKKRSAYSVSKYESERLVAESGLDAAILNPGVILGPGHWQRGSSLLFDRAAHGMLFYTVGVTGYVDVRDVAEIAARLGANPEPAREGPRALAYQEAEKKGKPEVERYVVVGCNLSYREFFSRVAEAVGVPKPRIRADRLLSGIAWRVEAVRAFVLRRRPGLTREVVQAARRINRYSAAKIIRETGTTFRTAEETIGWMAEWWRKK